MKKLAVILTALAFLGGASTYAADAVKKAEKREQREAKIDIEKRIHELNKLDNNAAAKRAGLNMVSHETAVPLPTIEAEHKEHPNVGIAGLLVANELATHTHKPVEHFIKAHGEKSWTEIVTANSANLDAIDAKLTRLEQAMSQAR